MNEFAALISTLPTKRDMNNFMSRIEEVERGIFRTSQDIDKFISEQLSARVATALYEYARGQQVNLADPSEATDFFKKLRVKISEFPVVTLRVAFEPTREQLSKISSWFGEGGQTVVLDVKNDPGVVGGAVVEYKGKIGDFSLRKKLENYGVDQISN